MIDFRIIKKSKRSNARLGILKTPHGEIETPALVAVGTQATVKTLTSEEVTAAKTTIIIANTFHLHLKPGEQFLKKAGGIHRFMNWEQPVMTDSGGYQVFSLGFGRDLGVGKIVKTLPQKHGLEINPLTFPRGTREGGWIKRGMRPEHVKITDAGVHFLSPVDGKPLFLGPRESIKIQEAIGADIMFAFDECTPPLCSFSYAERSLKRTHQWAKICHKERKTNQALFGIVQGSKYRQLRIESADTIHKLGFDGFGIGGDLGESKATTRQILRWVNPRLNPKKPRHLLGIGHLEDMELIIKEGIDTFDCTVPTHYARHGIAFTNEGRLDMQKPRFLKEKKPLDLACECMVCGTYRRDYLSHLVRAKEITGIRLLTFHNLFFFNTTVERIREKIKNGTL